MVPSPQRPRRGLAERFGRFLDSQLADPNAPVPALVARDRLRILGANAAMVGVVALIVVLFGHPSLAIIPVIMLTVAAVLAGAAPSARVRIVEQARHGVMVFGSLVLITNVLLSWLQNSSSASLSHIVGVSAGSTGLSIVTEMLQVTLWIGVIMVPLYEIRTVWAEFRGMKSRGRTYNQMLEIGRLRRARRD